MKENKDTQLADGVRNLMRIANYKLNESARYNQLVDIAEEFDEAPKDEDPNAKPPPIPDPAASAPPVAPPLDPNAPPAAELPPDLPPDLNAPPTDLPLDAAAPIMPDAAPVADTDTVQNDIIKQNIEAMKSIDDKINGLVSTIDGLNNQINTLSQDVEEVREPTNGEKLMSKKNVSYPYCLNLSDAWSDNWLEQKSGDANMEGEPDENGIRKLPDGTYIADFDDLPKENNIDKTFN